MVLLGRGLTPGKLLVGIRAVREDGSDLGWGLGFMREVVVKRVLGSVLWLFAGLYPLADGLWPLWDPRRQALHDKMAGTLVVRGRGRSSVEFLGDIQSCYSQGAPPGNTSSSVVPPIL